jgi:ABC-type multidrug transport system fused ATPase/permease subunit
MDAGIVHFVTALPLPLLLLVTLGVPVLLSVGIGLIIQAWFTPRELAANAVLGASKYGFIVEVYAVVAALSLVGSWDIYQTARDNLQREAGALYMLAVAVPSYGEPSQAPRRDEMQASIRGYAAAVAVVDWQHMQSGSNRSGSDREFERLARAFLDARPMNEAQQALVAQVAEARLSRLSGNSRSFGALIWLLVLVVSVAVLAFQWFLGSISSLLHSAMAGTIAVIVGIVLAVSAKFAFPFTGDPAFLTPTPFLQLMQVGA